jgi:hypothetical protein
MSLEYPCPLKEPETQRQSMYIYPSASIGFQAFSAGIKADKGRFFWKPKEMCGIQIVF